MPHRRNERRASFVGELIADVVTTAVLTLVFHFLFDWPWGLALLVAGPISIFGWWCLLHLERDESGSGESFFSRVFDD